MTLPLKDRVRAFVLEHWKDPMESYAPAWCELVREVLDARDRERDVEQLARLMGQYILAQPKGFALDVLGLELEEEVFEWKGHHVYYDVDPPIVLDPDAPDSAPLSLHAMMNDWDDAQEPIVVGFGGRRQATQNVNMLWMEWGNRLERLAGDALKVLVKAGLVALDRSDTSRADGASQVLKLQGQAEGSLEDHPAFALAVKSLQTPCPGCSECQGERHHFSEATVEDDPDHPAAQAGLPGWYACKHCSAWVLDFSDEGWPIPCPARECP